MPVDTFIGRMVQHTMPKGFQRIRHYGIQATKTFTKVKKVIQAALAKVEAVKGAVKIIARLTYRQRHAQSRARSVSVSSLWERWRSGVSGIHLRSDL